MSDNEGIGGMTELEDSIARGLAQSAAGETVDLGDFSQYAEVEQTAAIAAENEALRTEVESLRAFQLEPRATLCWRCGGLLS